MVLLAPILLFLSATGYTNAEPLVPGNCYSPYIKDRRGTMRENRDRRGEFIFTQVRCSDSASSNQLLFPIATTGRKLVESDATPWRCNIMLRNRLRALERSGRYKQAEAVRSTNDMTPENIRKWKKLLPSSKNPDPQNCKPRAHAGIDIARPEGTPVYAPYSGAILTAVGTWKRGGPPNGKYVVIDFDPGKGAFQGRFLHLSRIPPHIKPGSRVRRGDIIGYVGTTGSSEGPHLHFELDLARAAPTKCAIGSRTDVWHPGCFPYAYKVAAVTLAGK